MTLTRQRLRRMMKRWRNVEVIDLFITGPKPPGRLGPPLYELTARADSPCFPYAYGYARETVLGKYSSMARATTDQAKFMRWIDAIRKE